MRIAFLTTEYGDVGSERGGLGYHLARALPRLAATGHECHVFLSAAARDDMPRETAAHGGVWVHHVAPTSATPFDDTEAPAQVRRHLRSAWAIAEALETRTADAPFDVVQAPNYGLSGLFVDVPTPMIMRFSSHAPTWHAAAGADHSRRAVLTEMLQRRAMERADVHFAPSRFVAALVTQELGIDVQVIRPPVPAEIDRRQWDTGWVAGVVGETRYVVHAGQLGPAKGTDLVLTAAESHLRDDPDFHLHLCGRDAGAQPHINRLRRAYGDRVHYHGRLGRERLHPLMEQAVALMCPSRADNLPNVAIEAMSLGVPVVGVRGASIDELVVDGQSGFLAPVGDAGGLAAALSAAWLLPDGERQAMGARARTQVLQMLDEQKCCRDLEDLYSRAAQSQLPPRRPRHEVALHVRADLAAVSRLSQDRPASDRSWRQMMRSVASGVGLLR